MIQEAYCSFEISKLLKEKGFNESIRCWYDNFRDFHEEGVRMSNTDCLPPTIMCPTHQMAMAWLREVHNICIVIEPHAYDYINEKNSSYVYSLWQGDNYYENPKLKSYPSYEEAVEAALKYVLKNLI